MQSEDDIALPTLRSDIQLNEAPPEPEGAPTWTLYDPSANKYYKIGWLEFECLARFKDCKTGSELAKKVRAETTLSPDEDTVKALVMFLLQNNLIYATREETMKYFETQRIKHDKPWWERMLHGYLFFTVPLFKPQKFLQATFPIVSPLFTRQFMTLVMILLGYGIYLSIRHFDELTTTFMNYLNFEGAVLLLMTTIFVKIIHELGHAYTATKYGVPVSNMGIACIVLYPMLYTETTNAWKMQNRRDRLIIAGGGLMAETALASVALILWHVLQPGLAQSICFMVAIVSLAASAAVNLNPLMKFDGYYLFSDLVGVDNLQDRSFAFVKWRLRKILWGWNDPPPEMLPREKQKFLTVFGFAMATYRFFLFLGIALLVYHVFFQPLGFILMMVELAFFIFLPILREVMVWVKRFEDIWAPLRGKIALGLALAALSTAFMPFHRSVEIPAVFHARDYTKLYTPIPAKIEEVLVKQGERVEQGQVLMRLSSEDLDFNITLMERRLKSLQGIRDSGQALPELAKKRVMIESEIKAARKELEGYEQVKAQLEIKAPFAGQMKMLDPALQAGQWINTNVLLGLLADDSQQILSGYVREQDIQRLEENTGGTFYAEYSPFKKFDVVLKGVEDTGAYEIFWPELASPFGGPIPAERGSEGQVRPLPRHTIYAARFDFSAPSGTPMDLPGFIARGIVRIEAEPTSLANLLIKKALSVFIMEGGF